MAGTLDMLYDDRVEDAPVRLVKIIDLVFDKDLSAVVLVAQIPMIGLMDDGYTFLPLQRRIVQYNAAIAAIVNRMVQEQGRRILKIHTTTTTWNHQDGDYIAPNGEGYLRMAYDFLEGITLATAIGWLNERQTFSNEAAPAASGIVVTAGSAPASSTGLSAINFASSTAEATETAILGFNTSAPTETVVCSQLRPTDAPDSNNITSSLFDGLSQLDFVKDVACNETTVCKNSPDSDHPDMSRPAMNNGSTCVWASQSGSDESNNYQLVITRPNTTYPLSYTVCPYAIENILSTCIVAGNAYSGYWGAEGLSFNLTNLNFPGSPFDLLPSSSNFTALAAQKKMMDDINEGPFPDTNATSVE